MTTIRKPAMKLSASWTPDAKAGEEILAAALGPEGRGIRVTGGKLHMSAAIATDLADPASVARASDVFAEIKRRLSEQGRILNFEVRAGTALAHELVSLGAAASEAQEAAE